MKKQYYVLVLSFFLSCIKVGANPTITFFFRPSSDIEKMMHIFKKPGNLAKSMVNGMVNHSSIAGISVLYFGYITASDYNGEVIFPRKHQKSAVTIVVTPELFPVALFENTVHHWELIPGVPVAMYVCEQKYNDKTEEYYWDSKEISVPMDRKIPLEAIIIVAKPKNIIIPSGITPTRETANLVLPPLYITKGINIVDNSTYMLTLRHLFRPVDLQNKREPIQILTHVID
jgi:hypothetical protein